METLSRDRQITLLRGPETGCYFPHWETLAASLTRCQTRSWTLGCPVEQNNPGLSLVHNNRVQDGYDETILFCFWLKCQNNNVTSQREA